VDSSQRCCALFLTSSRRIRLEALLSNDPSCDHELFHDTLTLDADKYRLGDTQRYTSKFLYNMCAWDALVTILVYTVGSTY
jgi:hypothetical protein